MTETLDNLSATPAEERAEPLDLSYSLVGPADRPVVLFLHGITGSRHYFLRKVKRLTRSYRLLLPDLPGFGESPKPRTAYTLELYRDAVRRTVESAGCQHRKIHIVGHSLGGLIALEYASRFPDHVDRLVILNLPRFDDSRLAHEIFWKGSPNYRRLLNEHSMTETFAQWKRTGFSLMMQYMLRFPFAVIRDSRKFTMNSLTSTLEHCLLNYRVDELLERVPARPTLLLHGGRDQVAPLDNVRDLPGRFEFMHLREIPSSGHHIFLTHTRTCMRMIEQHLNGRRVAGPSRVGAAVRRLLGNPT